MGKDARTKEGRSRTASGQGLFLMRQNFEGGSNEFVEFSSRKRYLGLRKSGLIFEWGNKSEFNL